MVRRLLVLLAIALLIGAACGDDDDSGDDGEAAQSPSPQTAADGGCEEGAEVSTDSGLTYVELECGTGAEAVDGAAVQVHYTGTLEDGTEFDSSRGRAPLPVTLGAGGVIPGFEEGLLGMKVGGRRELTIPPELGYGEAGNPPAIPPNSTIIFEVELIEVTGA
ncbi:MAG: FKBP-type peptidyl-prolyl cis-trans isomerase [Actinomycetota bacterium]